MNRSLSEQQIELLSAYLDGEVSEAERLEAERLVDASAEARTWLRDARTVRSDVQLNTGRVLTAESVASRMSGDSIIAASQSGGWMAAAGASKFAILAYATIAVVILGAGWLLLDPLSNGDKHLDVSSAAMPRSADIQSIPPEPVLDVRLASDEPVSVEPDESLAISDLDFEEFVVDGIISLPGSGSGQLQVGSPLGLSADERILMQQTWRNITDQQSVMSLIDRPNAVVRANGSYYIRADVLAGRVELLEAIHLDASSSIQRARLERAVESAKEESNLVFSAMMAGGADPPEEYFIELDRNLLHLGSQSISVNGASPVRLKEVLSTGIELQRLSVREPKPRHRRRIARQTVEQAVPKNRDDHQGDQKDRRLNTAIDSLSGPAFIDLQIIVSSDHGRVIISDAADTSYVQQFKTGKDGSEKIYLTLDRLSRLTDSLNILIGRQALDKSVSTEKRARQIVTQQQRYILEVKELLQNLQPDSSRGEQSNDTMDSGPIRNDGEEVMYRPMQHRGDSEPTDTLFPMPTDQYDEQIVDTEVAGVRTALSST